MPENVCACVLTYPCCAGQKVPNSASWGGTEERRLLRGSAALLLLFPFCSLNQSKPTTRRWEPQLLPSLCLITMHELCFFKLLSACIIIIIFSIKKLFKRINHSCSLLGPRECNTPAVCYTPLLLAFGGFYSSRLLSDNAAAGPQRFVYRTEKISKEQLVFNAFHLGFWVWAVSSIIIFFNQILPCLSKSLETQG